MNTKNIITYLLCAIFCTSCSDVLDKDELNSITDDNVWNDVKYVTAYLDKIHRDNVPRWEGGSSSDCDESGPTSSAEYSDVLFGRMTTNKRAWKDDYDQIRIINIFLEKLEISDLEAETVNQLRAQALVIRAWKYFDLTRIYGGVPIIDHTQSLSDDLFVERAKAAECINFIVKDLDDAIAVSNFPYQWTGSDAGRISKAAALALKGRVLLYWASPQFNPNGDQARWQTAYTANQEAVNQLSANGYGLLESFHDIFLGEEMHKEVVFVKRYEYPHLGHSWESSTHPKEAGIALNAPTHNRPTWDLAASFPMISGKPADASNPEYDDVLFWKDRDPRFAETFVWNSCVWELYNRSGFRYWTFAETDNPSSTHMYCRKAVHENYDFDQSYSEHNSSDWIEIRYAEVLMNFAEAAAALGKTDEAIGVLKQIRQRAGIHAGSDGMYGLKSGMSKEELLSAVWLERKIEFAFENKRFWDLRRNRLFASELNGKYRHGRLPILIVDAEVFEAAKETADWSVDYGKYFRDEIDEADNYTIQFKDEYYFYPVHTDDLITNSKIQQTKGWEGGTFDPLN